MADMNGIGASGAGFLRAYTIAHTKKKNDDAENALKGAMVKLYQAQLDHAQQQNQRVQSGLDTVNTMMAPPPAPVPHYDSAPDTGASLGDLQLTGTTPAGNDFGRKGMSLTDILADPKGQIAMLNAYGAQEIQRLQQQAGQNQLAGAMAASDKGPADFFQTPAGAAAAMRAGAKPEDLMRMTSQNNLPGSLQELSVGNAYNKAHGLKEVAPFDYLTGRSQSADRQLYNSYLSTVQPGQTPLPMDQFLVRFHGDTAAAKGAAEQGAITSAIPGQVVARTQAEQQDKLIADAYRAADALPVANRGLELLKEVETGGLNTVGLKVKNFFGVTGANEAELSANLGKAVLSQLRGTFGAQFTQQEGERLQEIEAGFGKSTAANIRLLEQAQKLVKRVADRGLAAAQATGRDFDAQQIQKSMALDLNPDAQPPATGGWSVRRK
jgi:hypothetical protein